MSTISDDPLYRDPSLAQFYDTANRWGPDFDFCMTLAEGAQSVLDLGCGTGELTAALAATRIVTGVDPAAAMLEIGRARPGGDKVEWVEGDARTVRLGKRYDLIVLTGHAFQVFLTEEDQRAALATIAAHLSPAGRFVFDTRNPSFQRERDICHSSVRQLEHQELGVIEASDESHYDETTGILSYENGYRVLATGEHFAGRSKILYTPARQALGLDARCQANRRCMVWRLGRQPLPCAVARDHSSWAACLNRKGSVFTQFRTQNRFTLLLELLQYCSHVVAVSSGSSVLFV